MAETIALVGGDSLLGRELRDVLAGTPAGQNVRLVADVAENAGTLTAIAGEPEVLIKLDVDAFDGAAAVLLAGSSKAALQVAGLKLTAPLIDLTHATEAMPAARLRAPMVEPYDYAVPPDAIQVIAHPAAIAVAVVLNRIHAHFPIRRALVHIFEPASELGAVAIEELQQQTVSLLSFKPVPKQIFDSQLSFTMLARFGEEAKVKLQDTQERIERHLATLLSIATHAAPMPSLRVIQAPVFHGYSMSLWAEFENNPGVDAIEAILKDEPIDLRPASTEPPNNVGVAGQNGVAVGAISVDRNAPQALWLWIAADNLRLAAENAAAVAREVM